MCPMERQDGYPPLSIDSSFNKILLFTDLNPFWWYCHNQTWISTNICVPYICKLLHITAILAFSWKSSMFSNSRQNGMAIKPIPSYWEFFYEKNTWFTCVNRSLLTSMYVLYDTWYEGKTDWTGARLCQQSDISWARWKVDATTAKAWGNRKVRVLWKLLAILLLQ